jgi:hypothetical protein
MRLGIFLDLRRWRGLLDNWRGDFRGGGVCGKSSGFLGFSSLATGEDDKEAEEQQYGGRNLKAEQCHRGDNSETTFSCVPPVAVMLLRREFQGQ